MKQWHFKIKKLCSKTLKTLTNELNRPVLLKWEFSQKKAICIIVYSYWKNQNISCLTDKVLLMMRRRSECGTRNRHQRIFRKV